MLSERSGVMDSLGPEARSERMSRIRSGNTGPEMKVRRLLHAKGYRYRLHGKALPGKPDLVFASRRKLVFVHGCFWHRHSDPSCKLSRTPKSRLDFWEAKFAANVARDAKVRSDLDSLGWKSLVVWECELNNMEQVGNDIVSFLECDA